MKGVPKLRYKVNYDPPTYKYNTKKYEHKEGVYPNYEEARANRWKCEKCSSLFGNLPRLRQHKIECHSY
jgi:hypothetical protein